MLPTRYSLGFAYSLAIIAPVVVTAGKLLLEPVTGNESPFVLFVLAIMATAWYGGFRPAIVASAIAAALSDYFFISPGVVLFGNSLNDSVRLGLFVTETVIISWVVASWVAAREALKEAARMKDDFIAILAHELRNCLAPLQLASHMIEMSEEDPTALSEARAYIDRQIRRMTLLVDDLLESSRALRGKIKIDKTLVDIREICKESAKSMDPLVEQRKQSLTLALPAVPLLLEADPLRLTQVTTNLLTNASKYTEEGGSIQLTCEQQSSAVVIKVRDNGMGIDPEVLPHVFEPFMQSRSAARSSDGLGVGLSLVRTIVELHGGKVSAHSDGPGKGSEFVIELPALVGKTHAEPHVLANRHGGARISHSN